jgi:lipoprotein-anchoring transpeptidase ErfK/SrfK
MKNDIHYLIFKTFKINLKRDIIKSFNKTNMTFLKMILKSVLIMLLFSTFVLKSTNRNITPENFVESHLKIDTVKSILVKKDIAIKYYFQYLDSLVESINNSNNGSLTEHILVRHNPWIIDRLKNTDYYKMMEKDSFVYNQKDLIALKKGSKIIFPDSLEIEEYLTTFNNTFLDINIPEYRLRIFQDSFMVYEFPVRVGRNERKYLKMGDRVTDLKTKTGIGKIVAHVKDPDYYNPVNGRQYFVTRRDDDKITKCPQIPWLETEINGFRNGQLIHPTTNPNTLNKAYSNGCIGTREGDAWIIYYYAPINTKVIIRYHLLNLNEQGDTIRFKNIYEIKQLIN